MSNPQDRKEQLEQRKQNAEILRTFIKLARTKLNAQASEVSDVYRGPDSHHYKSEMQIVSRLNAPGVIWGVGGGIASFIFLTRGPKMMTRFLQRRSGGYRLHSPVESPFAKGKDKDKEGSPVLRLGFFLVNVTLSLWTASLISVWKTDKKEVYEAVAELPLVQGKSFLSDMLCQDFIAEYRRYPKEFWDNTREDSLITVSRFVANCRRRAEYEKKLRAEGGLSPDESVSIPAPGVPPDLELSPDGDEPEQDASESVDKFYEPEFARDEFNDSGTELDTWQSFDDFEGRKSSSVPNSKRK